MSLVQYEDYVTQLKFSQEVHKAETLRIQRKFLYALWSHHQLWAKHTETPEVAWMHEEAADQIQNALEQYDQLLNNHYLNNSDIGV